MAVADTDREAERLALQRLEIALFGPTGQNGLRSDVKALQASMAHMDRKLDDVVERLTELTSSQDKRDAVSDAVEKAVGKLVQATGNQRFVRWQTIGIWVTGFTAILVVVFTGIQALQGLH